MAHVRKTKSADEVRNAVPATLGHGAQVLDYIGPEGLRFDDQGMVLPHSILGSLKDFRRYLEVKGETELVKWIPKSQRDPPSELPGRCDVEAAENKRRFPSGQENIQSKALQHWHAHMQQRRRQQNFLSGLLHRPAENLLMSQASRFRETQEQREYLSQVMPLVHSGYGYRVGSEFWSLPQRYGDEMSGITATLTQTEQGKRESITHVGHPRSIRQETGEICADTPECQKLGEVPGDMEIKKPDISGLEVIGSAKPLASAAAGHRDLLEKEEGGAEVGKEDIDPPARRGDARPKSSLVPALRFCGQLASWTGNSGRQGEVGIKTTIMFEAVGGERASSHLELRNEGTTAIFFSWRQLPGAHSFSNLQSPTKSPHFYFDSASGVIVPGDTKEVELVFKSERPGISTERWQLVTHPVLLQGASLQVTLRGVSLYLDAAANQRQIVQTKLEKAVMTKTCRSIVYEILRGIYTPERPSSPAELYITEEQKFLQQNPKLQYLDQPVEDLKRLWEEVNPGHAWDLSIDTLRQAVLSLPEQESAEDTATRETGLMQLNCLLVKLSEPLPKHNHLTATAIGRQLWRRLLDTMDAEAMRLTHLLSLSERHTRINKKDAPSVSDSELTTTISKAPEVKSRSSRSKDDNKQDSKSAKTEKPVEDSQTREMKTGDDARKLASATDTGPESTNNQPTSDQNLQPEMMDIYTKLLHQKVYALLRELVDAFCELMDELDGKDGQETPPGTMYFDT